MSSVADRGPGSANPVENPAGTSPAGFSRGDATELPLDTTDLVEVQPVARPRVIAFTRWFLIVVPPVVAAFYAWQVAALPTLAHEPIVSPRAWPTGVAVVMGLGAVTISLGAIFKRWGVVPEHPGSELGSWRDILVTLGSIAVFALVVEPLGYLLSAFLLVTGLSLLVSPARWLRNLIAAAAFAVLSSLLFAGLLDVRLPEGLIPLPWS